MLPTTAQHRLYRHVPGNKQTSDTPLTIEYYTPTGAGRQTDVWLDVFWAEEHHTPTYPCVALELSPTGLERFSTQTLSETVRKRARPDDPTIAYERVEGTQLYDVLSLTVAVKDGQDGVPKGALAKEIAQAVSAAFRFNAEHLAEPGVTADGEPLFGPDANVDALDWAQPMVIEPTPGEGMMHTSAMVDEQHISRYEMSFRVNYELTHSVLVEAVEAIEYDVYVDGNPATSEVVGLAQPTVGAGVIPPATQGAE